MSADDPRVAAAQLLAQDAAELERRGWPKVGVLRRAARMLLEVPEQATPDGCAGKRAAHEPAADDRKRPETSRSSSQSCPSAAITTPGPGTSTPTPGCSFSICQEPACPSQPTKPPTSPAGMG